VRFATLTYLARIGILASVSVASVRDHCLAPSRTVDAPLDAGARYGRLFPELSPLEVDEVALLALGVAGGVCDGGIACIDAEGASGWPLFGQFVAHDITADRSPLALRADPEGVRNFHAPRANLEPLYGDGPAGAPYLYRRDDPAKLLLGRAGDHPRNSEGVALIGDPRNDVHLFVARLHTAFARAHNGIVDRLREDGVAESLLFQEARRATTWHYQWILLEDYLPRIAPAATTERRFYRPEGSLTIPLEFADAAFRYGHAQIRHTYRLVEAGEQRTLFPDLLGFRPAEDELDWAALFDLPDRRCWQPAKRIDGTLARSLIELPLAITGVVDVDAYHSLAARDLQRGQALGLPAGESVARAIDATPVDSGLGWEGTPLWYYVLLESDGERLGPVGATIVGEVLRGIVELDPESYLVVDPTWRPSLPAPGPFGLGDLLAFAQ
jgi:Animal haem peroxidase